MAHYNVPPTIGEIRINTGANGWDYLGQQSASLSTYRSDESIMFTSSANTFYNFIMTPSFPSALYGRNLSVSGVEYCYAASANAYVNLFAAYAFGETDGTFSSSYTSLVFDDTNRTDSACRYYSFTPQAMDDNTILSVNVSGVWGPSGAGASISLGRVTFFLQPTDTPVLAP